MDAKHVCQFVYCPHNVLFQLFNIPREPIVNGYVRECGGCMRAITKEEEDEGACGMRRPASQMELAEIYCVRLNSIQHAEKSALRKTQKKLKIRL